jgi:hypothetical protein
MAQPLPGGNRLRLLDTVMERAPRTPGNPGLPIRAAQLKSNEIGPTT